MATGRADRNRLPQNSGSSAASAESKRAPHRPRRTDWQEVFLEGFQTFGIETHAAQRANVSLDTIARERQRDEEFAIRYREAERAANGVLELIAFRRATDSTVVRERRVKTTRPDGSVEVRVEGISDALLTRLLVARMPEKYGDHSRIEVKSPAKPRNGFRSSQAS